MAGPSKFTAARVKGFLEAIAYGASIRTAAAEIRVGHQTALRWIEKGKNAEPDSQFGQFYEDFLAAQASPRMRALRSVWAGVADDPKLAFRVLQTLEHGWAPPMPAAPALQTGPVIVNLSLTGSSSPIPTWVDTEVIDAQEVPALGDGGDGPADTAAGT